MATPRPCDHPVVRDLRVDEFERIGEIDRSERIDGHYVVRDGELRFVDHPVDVAGWFEGELPANVERVAELHRNGGDVVGAFADDALVAFASLDARPVVSLPAVLKLDMLYVGAPFRHRGIGTQLTSVLAGRARRSRGAKGLYVSATPTRNTVDSYLRMGARLLELPDPDLLALEPEDIHLLLAIS